MVVGAPGGGPGWGGGQQVVGAPQTGPCGRGEQWGPAWAAQALPCRGTIPKIGDTGLEPQPLWAQHCGRSRWKSGPQPPGPRPARGRLPEHVLTAPAPAACCPAEQAVLAMPGGPEGDPRVSVLPLWRFLLIVGAPELSRHNRAQDRGFCSVPRVGASGFWAEAPPALSRARPPQPSRVCTCVTRQVAECGEAPGTEGTEAPGEPGCSRPLRSRGPGSARDPVLGLFLQPLAGAGLGRGHGPGPGPRASWSRHCAPVAPLHGAGG